MNDAAEILEKRLADLLRWERRKRREEALASLLLRSLVAALLLAPFYARLGLGHLRWFVPILMLALGAPAFFLAARWRRADSIRALARVDRSLRTHERVLTAWEVLGCAERRAAAFLVLKQAADKLATVNPKTMFRRTWSRQAYAIVPLLVVWLAVTWLDVSLESGATKRSTGPILARQLEEFSRSLEERATSERLPETLRVSRDLAELARKGLEQDTEDEKLRAEVSGIMKKVELAAKSGADQDALHTGQSRQYLNDLQAEVESMREFFNMAGAEKPRGAAEQWLDRLTALPRLKREFQQSAQNATIEQGELKTFLERMEKQLTSELDRRGLLDAQQFLEQLARRGAGEPGDNRARGDGQVEDSSRDDRGQNSSEGEMPGHQTASGDSGPPSLPDFSAGGADRVKGSLGPGDIRGIPLKGKPAAGTSAVANKEVVASYRRQAEAELETEGVPEALRETIKNYFLSLDEAGQR